MYIEKYMLPSELNFTEQGIKITSVGVLAVITKAAPLLSK